MGISGRVCPNHVDGDYWIALAGDGSRRIVDWRIVDISPGQLGQELYDRNPGLPIHYCRDIIGAESILPGMYIGYDWRPFPGRVNQIPYLQTYQRNAAVSAHDLQVTLGTDVMQSATAADYNTVKNTFIHLIGAAWQTVRGMGSGGSRSELIIGGNYDGTPLWSRNLDDHAATDEALCGTCDIANFARRFYFHANLPLFRQVAPERDNLLGGPEHQPLGIHHLRRGQPAGEPVLRRPGHRLP